MICRFCGKQISNTFIDLGSTAVSNAFLTAEQLLDPEKIFPLKVLVCDNCFLVQVDELRKRDEIFTDDYVYFSSVSSSWINHSKDYVDKITERINLNHGSQVIEIASNDGYLLQFFKQKNIPCLGIEPTKSTAEISIGKGIETITEFFDETLAMTLESEDRKADLIIGNNVLAHVPGLNSFVRGLKIALKFDGVITLEFPHLIRLIENNEFDTIYHEHFSYFSFYVIKRLFEFHGFEIFDVEELATHGGSLRVYAKHRGDKSNPVSSSVDSLYNGELELGIDQLGYYQGFQEKAQQIKNQFLSFILKEKEQNKTIAAFGAAAKGNTFLNFCGIKGDLIDFVVDDTPFKQGKYLPQSHIPVVTQDYLKQQKPDIIVILPWNFKTEIIEKLEYTKEWGAKLITYIPELQIH